MCYHLSIELVCADVRIEDYLYQKIDKKKPDRLNNTECLGQHMIDAGNEFGPGTSYGKRYHKPLDLADTIQLTDAAFYSIATLSV